MTKDNLMTSEMMATCSTANRHWNKKKRYEFECEKGCRYKLADAQWPEVALG